MIIFALHSIATLIRLAISFGPFLYVYDLGLQPDSYLLQEYPLHLGAFLWCFLSMVVLFSYEIWAAIPTRASQPVDDDPVKERSPRPMQPRMPKSKPRPDKPVDIEATRQHKFIETDVPYDPSPLQGDLF